MNIEKTGFTYHPAPGAIPSTRSVPREPDRAGSAQGRMVGSDQSAVSNPSPVTSEAGPALSDYLSREEKDMLNVLFPPLGRDVGIRAYREGATQSQSRDHVGQKVDLTT